MLKAYKNYWRNYVNFKGRATRSDFWWVVLFNYILRLIWFLIAGASIVTLVMQYLRHHSFTNMSATALTIAIVMILILIAYSLAIIIPNITLQYRRLVDTGLNPWWFLLVVASYISSGLVRFGTSEFSPAAAGFIATYLLLQIAILIINVSKTDAFKKD